MWLLLVVTVEEAFIALLAAEVPSLSVAIAAVTEATVAESAISAVATAATASGDEGLVVEVGGGGSGEEASVFQF